MPDGDLFYDMTVGSVIVIYCLIFCTDIVFCGLACDSMFCNIRNV